MKKWGSHRRLRGYDKKRILDVETTLLRHNASLNEVTIYEKAYSCSVDFITSDHRNATSKVICDYILELVRDSSNVITPNFMVDEMRRKYGTIISYTKGWFQYAFFSYGASIIGWTNCRPIIMVDTTFLKSKYRGVLMIAVSEDGKNDIFPLAFGIADSKNNESYNWFFNQLRNTIRLREQLSILSDRHPAIINTIINIYLECQHGICIYHMEKNLRKRYFSDMVLSLFYNTATTYKQTKFYTFVDEIEKVDKVAAEYLKKEEPERWAHSFHTNRRYNMLTTNNVESMNAVLRKSRQLPILGLIDYIQNKLQS
ncbi:uncharacterized protein LOC124897942 [Capsicum annuum]|uniref:uncharacterized protein LOC124897942 n=1 Tax=Capsicum annuum TaxID=4072 RepID=UPI001FB05FE6|nr:uncharacterized protein LOC124897942 [Capsicum annuum]